MVNRLKPGAESLAGELAEIASSMGVDVRISSEPSMPEGFLEGVDACCVIGGDGTLLGVIQQALRFDVAIIGVNLGKLGFLVTISPHEAQRILRELLEGKSSNDSRLVLQLSPEAGVTHLALNDVVVRERSSRLARFSVQVDNRFVTDYRCDGLIVSSSTGSTAYNLSAGGPLIHPESEAIAMTPICPHTLSNRSVILPPTSHLRISWETTSDCPEVSFDGKELEGLKPVNLSIDISVHEKRLRLLHDLGYDYFETVRRKLNWGEYSPDRKATLGVCPTSPTDSPT